MALSRVVRNSTVCALSGLLVIVVILPWVARFDRRHHVPAAAAAAAGLSLCCVCVHESRSEEFPVRFNRTAITGAEGIVNE